MIFEFGYFVGRLGREKVCCLYKENVTLPTDTSGLVYKKIADSIDEVAYYLLKELRIAGFEPRL